MTILVHPDLRIPPELSSQYERVLANLASHHLPHGLNKELLHSRARVYSVRINHKARLLIAPCRDEQGKSFWVVLECLDDHKYESVYLRINQDELEQRILAIREGQALPVSSLAPAAVAATPLETAVPPELTFYQDRVIQLTTEQHEVITADFPLVVNGVAGSGKTCVGLSTLRQAALAWQEDMPPIAYVTTSPKLVEEMQRNYQQTYGTDKHVLFLTYAQVLECALRGSFDGFVNDEHLKEWFTHYISSHKQLAKFKIDMLCREFRQVCTCIELRDYIEIGARHSLLFDEDKNHVFSAYQAYREHLAIHKRIHPDLYHGAVRSLFSLVVADESQDLSPAALEILSKITCRDVIKHAPQIMYLADANQSLENGNLLVFHHLNRLVGEGRIKNLPVSHRCPDAVIAVANRLLTLRSDILGGVYDKFTQSSLKEHTGSLRGEVRWVESIQAEWSSLQDRPDFAVLTSPERLEEARSLFNTPLIFTPAQIKGLEYHYVVVYGLLGEEIKAINETLRNRQEGVALRANRARRDELTQEQVSHVIYLNQVFTAFTRALHTLVLFQAQGHHNREVIKFLNPNITSPETERTQMGAVCDSSAAWQRELRRQEMQGNTHVVSSIQRRLDKLRSIDPISPVETKIAEAPKQPEQLSQPVAGAVTTTSTPIPVEKQSLKATLGPRLAQYVEGFLKEMSSKEGKNNEQNVSDFLKHEKAHIMLLMHKMKNGKTLFENLIINNWYSNFKTYIKHPDLKHKYPEILKSAIKHPPTSMDVLVSLLISEWESCHQTVLQRWGQNEEEKTQSLSLIIAAEGCDFVAQYWSHLKSLLTSKALSEPSQVVEHQGKNLFHVLTSTTQGLQFLKKKWNEIRPHLTEEALNRAPEGGPDHGRSALCWLVGAAEGAKLLKEKWDEIRSLFTQKGFNRPLEEENEKGMSPFYWLVGHAEFYNFHFLKSKWGDIKRFLTAEGLNRPAEAGQRGASPLYWLSCYDDTRRLFKEKWNEIQPLLTKEGLNRPVETMIKGTSPLYWLAAKSDGRQLLNQKWGDIQPLLTKEGFNQPAEDGPALGKSPLWWLACSFESTDLFVERGRDILALLTKDGLNRVAEEGDIKGQSVLYLLSSNVMGRKFLIESWDEILPLLTQKGLNSPAGAGDNKGISPLFWFAVDCNNCVLTHKWNEIQPLLTMEGLNRAAEGEEYTGLSPLWLFVNNPDSLQILNEKWDEIRPLMTKEGLNRAVGVGETKGASVLWLLIHKLELHPLIKEKWSEIQPLLTKEGLNRPVEAGKSKGISPLWLLVTTDEGCQLLIEKWSEIRPLMTEDGLNRAGKGGMSALYLLAAFPEGRQLLIDKWDEIQPLLTKEGVNQPAEEGRNKGKTPLWLLASFPGSRQLLIDKWAEIQPLLTKEGLNKAAEGAEWQGVSLFYWFATHTEGRQLVENNWNDLQPLLTVEGLSKIKGMPDIDQEVSSWINGLLNKMSREAPVVDPRLRFHSPALPHQDKVGRMTLGCSLDAACSA